MISEVMIWGLRLLIFHLSLGQRGILFNMAQRASKLDKVLLFVGCTTVRFPVSSFSNNHRLLHIVSSLQIHPITLQWLLGTILAQRRSARLSLVLNCEGIFTLIEIIYLPNLQPNGYCFRKCQILLVCD